MRKQRAIGNAINDPETQTQGTEIMHHAPTDLPAHEAGEDTLTGRDPQPMERTESPSENTTTAGGFDLDDFALDDDDTLDVDQYLTQVSIRKPTSSEYFRVSTSTDWPFATSAVKYEEQLFFPTKDMRNKSNGNTKRFDLYLAVNEKGDVFLIPVNMERSGNTNQLNDWTKSLLQLIAHAKERWVMRQIAPSGKGYSAVAPKGNLPAPKWPDESKEQLLKIAISDTLRIDSEDHFVIKRLQGVR